MRFLFLPPGAVFSQRVIELTSKEGRPARVGPSGWRPTPDITARLAFSRRPSRFHLLSAAETTQIHTNVPELRL